ncbi:MAG: hypothetical protein J5I94_23440 [Phaeodactylibacter sp.]|nr:hypothetical protein [Phaeodactylibacter sp.]
MKMIFVMIGIALVVLFGYLVYSGLFAKIRFEEKDFGGETLIYEEYIGDYSKVAPVMDEVYRQLRDDEQIDAEVGFGIYFDKPGEVPKEQLRSEVGCVLPAEYNEQADALAEKYKVKEFPVQRCIVAEMPYRNKMSILLGVFKTYPKLEKLLQEKGYPANPVMERYDVANRRIQYIMPIEG